MAMAIELQFADAKAKAKELDETAAQLRNMIQRQYTDTIDRISACWKGNSADLYRAKADRLRNDILNSARRIEMLAQNLRQSIRTMEEAERRAQEIARLRKYK